MFKSKVFSVWYGVALMAWVALFFRFDSFTFLAGHWYYPAVMVVGAFVAGLTPMGGGSVAFPALSIFLHIDRVLARDFSMMIQSIGMTSATIFILTRKGTVLKNYLPVLYFVPICFAGFVVGMITLQTIPVYLIQALFLSLTAAFVIAYYFHKQRGTEDRLSVSGTWDAAWLGLTLFFGGMVTSLFGTGADILVYTILITHFSVKEKTATYISIVLQAAISILGFSYRVFVDHGLTHYQIDTWLCAYPVVLFMAPFGAYILRKLHLDWMLIAVVLLALFQMLYFNLSEPSYDKAMASAVFCALFSVAFYLLLRHIRAWRSRMLQAVIPDGLPPGGSSAESLSPGDLPAAVACPLFIPVRR